MAAFGTAYAAPDPSPPALAAPEAPAIPDVNAIVAQAKEMAKQFRKDETMWLALDDEFTALPPSMAFFANDFGHPREIVKNAPYTAEAVTESIQILGDGNRIVRKSTTLLARDGAGRTRQERKGDGRSGIYIYDPMEGRSIVLNESTRTATRIPRVPGMPSPPEPPMQPLPPLPPLPPPAAAGTGTGTGAGAGAGAGAGPMQIEMQPGRVTVRRKGAGGDDAGDREDVRVEVIRIGRGEHAGDDAAAAAAHAAHGAARQG